MAVVVTTAATSLTSQRVGLQAEPLDDDGGGHRGRGRGRGRGGDDD